MVEPSAWKAGASASEPPSPSSYLSHQPAMQGWSIIDQKNHPTRNNNPPPVPTLSFDLVSISVLMVDDGMTTTMDRSLSSAVETAGCPSHPQQQSPRRGRYNAVSAGIMPLK